MVTCRPAIWPTRQRYRGAGDYRQDPRDSPVAPLFEEDSLGLAPTIVLPEPLPDEDDSGDDPLRTYLREIHEVNLLTAADERMLACRMEEMICLDEVRAELAGAEGGQPSGTAMAVRLYERFYERRALAQVLSTMEH